jgi:hypothetical protein
MQTPVRHPDPPGINATIKDSKGITEPCQPRCSIHPPMGSSNGLHAASWIKSSTSIKENHPVRKENKKGKDDSLSFFIDDWNEIN